MSDAHPHFGKRVHNLKTKNANGYYTVIRNDGLIVARSLRKPTRFPLKLIVATVISLFCFKAFVLSAIGPGSYEMRLNILRGGTIIEKAGARALEIDPITRLLSAQIGPVFSARARAMAVALQG